MFATYKRRFFALLIDITILWIFKMVLWLVISPYYDDASIISSSFVFFYNILLIFYYPLLESSKWHGSIGKKIMKIQILDRNGKKISFIRACYRDAIFVFCLWGSIMYFFSPKHQCLHDYLSDTNVLHGNTNIERLVVLKPIYISIIIIWILIFIIWPAFNLYKTISFYGV